MNIFINPEEQRPRAGWRLLLQFIIMFFFAGFATLIFRVLWPTSLTFAYVLPQCLGIVASIWLAAWLLDNRSITDYGLHFGGQWLKDFGAGVLIAGLAMASIFGIEWLKGWVNITQFGWNVPSEIPFATAIISSLLAMLMVGFYEELLSRGYQVLNLTEGLRFPQIGERGAVVIAVLATSTLFGFMHGGNPNVTPVAIFNIILAGIVLAIPYILTGSLALSIGLHFSWNFVQGAVLGFPVSGMNLETSVIQIQQSGAQLWTGGAFGPEAGLLGIWGMAIMAGGSLVYIKMMGYELGIASLFREEKSTVKTDEQGL
ncbi:MAG TPA: type II CAAX endopeptidase family protein [Balneolaceae bacterium]|nr:type II CAAX endopeptidase family protein [Balneolaceae bacterium]